MTVRMNTEHLVTMANQIARFFEAEANREDAVNAVTDHLKRFWDPRMRKALLAYVEENDGQGLKDIVVSALRANQDCLAGVSGACRTDERWTGPAGVSDAG